MGEQIIGRVVTLSNGLRGKVVGKLDNGDFLLGTGKGCQVSDTFKKSDVVEVVY